MKTYVAIASILIVFDPVLGQSIRPIYPLHIGDELTVAAVASNGTNVVLTGNEEAQGFVWTGGSIRLFGLAGAAKIEVKAISANGNIIVGDEPSETIEDANGNFFPQPNRGFIKTGDSAAETIPVPSGYDWIEVRGVSGNGTYVLVLAHKNDPTASKPYRWSKGGGYEALGTFDALEEPFPTALNFDGGVVAGTQANVTAPVTWSAVTNWQPVAGTDWLHPFVTGVNQTGSVLIGDELVDDSTDRYIPWRYSGGSKVQLPTVGANDSFSLASASADCSTAVGTSRIGNVRTAAIWSLGIGTRTLAAALSSVDLTGWNLVSSRSLSANGEVFAGTGTVDGDSVVFVASNSVSLPPGPPQPTPVPSPTPRPTPASTPKIAAVPKKTSKASVAIAGTTANATTVESTVNNGPRKKSPVRNGKFRFVAKLKVGKNSIRVRASGAGGYSAWKTLKVRREKAR